MNYKTLAFCLLILFSACKEHTYQPPGLTKLSDAEMIEKAKNLDIPPLGKAEFKTEMGAVIPIDSLMNYQSEEWTSDWYVDENGTIKEFVLRKATDQDKIVQQKIQEALESHSSTKMIESKLPPIEMVEIDCDKQREILQAVYESDQGMRMDDEEMNPEIDRQNLTTVISLIETCGMPTLQEVNQTHMDAIWLVLQHADNINRKKYFPLLEQSAKNGDLSVSQIALMQDRILMMDGEPQIYGSQVIQYGDSLQLYELAHPETVNKRRAEVGLEPLQDYLRLWDIEFTVEQKE